MNDEKPVPSILRQLAAMKLHEADTDRMEAAKCDEQIVEYEMSRDAWLKAAEAANEVADFLFAEADRRDPPVEELSRKLARMGRQAGIREADPELERLLAEEEEIERRTRIGQQQGAPKTRPGVPRDDNYPYDEQGNYIGPPRGIEQYDEHA